MAHLVTTHLTSHQTYYCANLFRGGKLGDNIFILITGYFSITTDKVNYLKIYRLWKQMVFFMLVDYFIAAAAGYTSFSFLSSPASFQ